MIPAVAQTLVNLLTKGTFLTSPEQISFSLAETHLHSGLSLYCYDVHPANQKFVQPLEDRLVPQENLQLFTAQAIANHPMQVSWFNISFLITAHDQTVLGTQKLLSEALITLCQYESIPERLLAPSLQGYGALPLAVQQMANPAALWCAMGMPLRPAVYIMVTVPVSVT
jgi:hypothetical protein